MNEESHLGGQVRLLLSLEPPLVVHQRPLGDRERTHARRERRLWPHRPVCRMIVIPREKLELIAKNNRTSSPICLNIQDFHQGFGGVREFHSETESECTPGGSGGSGRTDRCVGWSSYLKNILWGLISKKTERRFVSRSRFLLGLVKLTGGSTTRYRASARPEGAKAPAAPIAVSDGRRTCVNPIRKRNQIINHVSKP